MNTLDVFITVTQVFITKYLKSQTLHIIKFVLFTKVTSSRISRFPPLSLHSHQYLKRNSKLFDLHLDHQCQRFSERK